MSLTPAPFNASAAGLPASSAVQDCLMTGMVVLDAEGRIAAITPEAEALFALPRGAALRQPATLLPAEIAALVKRAQQEPDPAAVAGVEHTTASDPNFALRCRLIPLQTSGNERWLGLLLSGFGPTGDLERNLYHLNRLASLGALGTSSAHEMRNALVTVKTFVDLLLEKNREAELAGLVRNELNRLNGLIAHMLRFAGDSSTEKTPTSINEVIEQTLRLLKPELDARKVKVELHLSQPPGIVKGNAGELQQALLNLLLNSLDALPPGGKLALASQVKDHHVEVTVSDSGTGISEAAMPHLFEPFFSTKPQGTGLGLAITRRIIENHQGTIRAHSQPGQGASFVITLPAAAPAA